MKTSAQLTHCCLQVLGDGRVRLSRKAALLAQLGIPYSDDMASEARANSEEDIGVGKVYRCAPSLSPSKKPFANIRDSLYWLAGLAQMFSTRESHAVIEGNVRVEMDGKG